MAHNGKHQVHLWCNIIVW